VNAGAHEHPHIRPYKPTDDPALRAICFETALYGQPIKPLLDDPELISDLWLRYYLRFEPEHCWVAEVEDLMAGYLTGCHDTGSFRRIFVRSILPGLVARFLRKGHWRKPWFRRLAWQAITQGWQRLGYRAHLLADYPAHCHLNLAPGDRHRGIGSQLLETFLTNLREHKVRGIHVATATPEGKAFFLRHGFQFLSEEPAFRLSPSLLPILSVLVKRLD
jgi:ribosomal protein S18 acetylase RimI-like enzyme